MSGERIRQAETFFRDKGASGTFRACDILALDEPDEGFSLVIVHDVIEHVSDKVCFMQSLKRFLAADGVVFMAFPAWQMPFGGHQQIARNKVLSHCPFLHLLPSACYRKLLSAGGEEKRTVEELMDIRRTRCTVELFRNVAEQAGYRILDERLWLVNPHYETKFGLRPRLLNRFAAGIPWLRNFFSTSCFYLLRPM